MASDQLLAPLPFLTLDTGATLTVEAIDPATGNAVTGVAVSQFAIYATNLAPDFAPPEQDAPFPVFVPIGDDGTPI